MNVSAYPACCGINVISGFAYQENKQIQKDHKEFIQRKLAQMGVGVYQAALNQTQKPLHHDMLIELGFTEVVENFYNPNSGNVVSLYVKTVVADKVKPDVRPAKTKNSVFQAVDSYY